MPKKKIHTDKLLTKELTARELMDLVHKEYIKNGYAERWSIEYLMTHPDELQLVIDIAEASLISTEVTELVEDIRDANKEHYPEESADIAIRLFNFCTRNNIDLVGAIQDKHEKNLQREILHSRKV